MPKKVSVHFVLHPKVLNNGNQRVTGRITVNRLKAEFATDYSTKAKDWNASEGMFKRNNPLNEELQKLKGKIYEYKSFLILEEKEVTAKRLRDLLLNRTQLRFSLLDYVSNFIHERGLTNDLSPQRLKHYVVTEAYLRKVVKEVLKVSDVSLKEVNYDFVSNETIEINPYTFYKTGINFVIEDFEGITSAFEEFDISPATLSNSTNGAIYGDYCGRVELTEQDSVWNAKTNWDANLPKGREVYLEIDYAIQSNILISTEAGNGGGTNQSPYLEMQKSTAVNVPWKKIYVTLEENVSFEINATFYNIILTSFLPAKDEEATILIDNVKLVYFP